jgi:hypothetical protein
MYVGVEGLKEIVGAVEGAVVGEVEGATADNFRIVKLTSPTKTKLPSGDIPIAMGRENSEFDPIPLA